MPTSPLSALLLKWYARHGRNLPWRVKGGAHPDPYIVLVSEFMLQQTTVKTVIPYFERFMQRFPTIESLAAADIEDVYALWQGLGYYTRARSLHASAQTIAKQGYFPQTSDEVKKLKGIGTYTSASFLALAFNQPSVVVDGNVRRIICRMFHLTEPTDKIVNTVFKHAAELTDSRHAADYASAIMDLGALICTPKNPQCLLCPWQKHCLSANQPDVEQIPSRAKPTKKQKHGFVCLVFNQEGQVFIRRRTEKGLLSGLWEFPWTDDKAAFPAATATSLTVTHVFTHFKLTLRLCMSHTDIPPTKGCFIPPADLKNYPFSTLMKKVWRAYQKPSSPKVDI